MTVPEVDHRSDRIKTWLPIPAALEFVNCPACGASETTELLRHDGFGFPTHWQLCQCCGLAYCSPRPTAAFMGRFYEKHYLSFYEGRTKFDEDYVRIHVLREAADDRTRRYLKYVPPSGSVLDLGCGLGLFLHAVRASRPDVRTVGIEPGREQASYAEKVPGVTVLPCGYENFKADTPFDLITAFHVIEHLHDLRGFLAFCRANITDGGHLVVETPNLEGSWQDISMFHVAHLYSFTAASLTRVAETAGFAVVRVESIDRGWDRPNLHAVLQRTDAARSPHRVHAVPPADIIARVRGADRPRWICVAKSWARMALYGIGLGPYLGRRRARNYLGSGWHAK